MNKEAFDYMIEVQRNAERKIADEMRSKFVIITTANSIKDSFAKMWDVNPQKIRIEILTPCDLGNDFASIQSLRTTHDNLRNNANMATLHFFVNDKQSQDRDVYVNVNLNRLLGLLSGHEAHEGYMLQGSLVGTLDMHHENRKSDNSYDITDSCNSSDIPMVFVSNQLLQTKYTHISSENIVDAILNAEQQYEFNFDYFQEKQ